MMTRRTILGALVTAAATLGAGVVAIPSLITGLSPAFVRRPRHIWRPIGRLESFGVGKVHATKIAGDRSRWPYALAEQAVFVWRKSDDDVVVFSRNCTDLGCPLTYDPGSACFFCSCHGGVFAPDGRRLAGPPNRPMDRYAHRIRNGVLEIDITSVTAAA